jgi:hypothetical protein
LGTLLLDPENITMWLMVGQTMPNFWDGGQILSAIAPVQPSRFSRATLEALTSEVMLEATKDITIDPGVSLNFTPFGGSITFKADADGNNVGSFSMDTGASIIAKGRSVTITGASVTLGRLDTSTNDDGGKPGGDIKITATNGSVSAENLRSSSVPSFSNPGKGGDITVSASDRIDVTEAIQADSQVPRGAGTVAANGGRVELRAGNGISVRDIIDSRSQINRNGVATGTLGILASLQQTATSRQACSSFLRSLMTLMVMLARAAILVSMPLTATLS